jgi:protein-tyrosine phosphatase
VHVDRHVGFERLRNFRDLGGYRVSDGRTVRWGRLYRSDSLSKLAGDDLRRFAELGVRTVVDLRYPWEARQHGRVPESTGVDYHNLSIEHRPYDQASPAEDVSPVDYLAPRYAEVAEDGVVELRQVLEVVAAAATAPVVVHCASGKDRTGIVAALVLALLGVSERDIVADFALTGLATAGLVADWRGAYPDRTLRWPGYGQAPEALMRRFLAELAAGYGSVHGYARDRLGVGDAVVAGLRERLLVAEST